MKRLNVFFYFLSAFIATGAIVCFAALPLRVYRPVWQGYRVLAVPAAADPEAFIAAAEQAGISDIVSEFSTPQRFAFLQGGRSGGFPFTDEKHYIQWFTDEKNAFRYFYLPYTSFFSFIKLYASLYTLSTGFYLEPAFVYAPIKAAAALMLFLYCLTGCRKKTLFGAAAGSFVLYALSVRSSLSLTTALLSILSAAYWIEALGSEIAIPWKQLKERIRCNVFMVILPAVSFVSAAIDGWLPLLFYLLALILSGTALFSVYTFLHLSAEYKDKYRVHPSLKVFVMHPQSWSRFWNTRYAFTATALCGTLLFAGALLPPVFSTNRLNRSVKTLSIPHPVSRYGEPLTGNGFFAAQALRPPAYLPDLAGYIQDCWYNAAMPYLNVHMPIPVLAEDMEIRFDFFHEGRGGLLLREEKIMYVFNTEFIIRTLQHKRLTLLPLERMLLEQGGFTPAVHRNIRLFTVGKLASFFISLSTLFFPAVLIIIAKIQ
ncbi:MAG: hypothetical protein P1P65_03120 [Treponema sp.]